MARNRKEMIVIYAGSIADKLATVDKETGPSGYNAQYQYDDEVRWDVSVFVTVIINL